MSRLERNGDDVGRQRDNRRDKAYNLWIDSGKTKPLKEIASELGVPDGRVRKWKSEDNWEETKRNVPIELKRNVPIETKRNVPFQKKKKRTKMIQKI